MPSDIREGEKLNEAAFKALIRAAVAANSEARARRAIPEEVARAPASPSADPLRQLDDDSLRRRT